MNQIGEGFVELIGRTYYSFLKGASSPEEMVVQARRFGYKGLALCDLNGLYGVVQGYQAARKPSEFVIDEFEGDQSEFRYHIGAEIELKGLNSYALYPKNKLGYAQLCQLITLAKRRAPKGYSQLEFNELLSFCADVVVIALPPYQSEELKLLIDQLQDDLYLAVWQDQSWESRVYLEQALQLAQEGGLQLVATNRPFMHQAERKPLHDVITCIDQGLKLKESGRRRLSNSERSLHTLTELKALWSKHPEAIANTLVISNKLKFCLDEIAYNYPEISVPKGETHQSYLERLALEGLQHRFSFQVPKAVQEQALRELQLINELSFENYFLTLYEICEFARSRGILFQGRGSAANSVVCYALGLTAVDPSRIDLLFERFLSKERGEPPDIDIDFQSDRREEVLQFIYQRYGERHSAMVATVICFRSRLAVREVAKVLGLSSETISQLIHFMGREGLKRLFKDSSLSQQWGVPLKDFELLLSLSQQLVGFPRHMGIHSGGFLITREPIFQSAPVERASMQDRYVVQWSKEDLKTLKMMKIDILGLGMLAALNKAFHDLEKYKNITLKLHHIPEGDAPTYALIQRADTVGVFQIESRAQMSLLPRLKPQNFYDIVVEVAIVRPGPLQGGMVHPYIRRRHGKDTVEYAHADLEPILKKTLGVPIFQEQIMQMAVKVCGFTPGEADELRRIMTSAWTKKNQMEGLRRRLIQGMLQHGISKEYAEQIYQTIVGFGAYGFPESHAASFALLTYASCYLKQHHPEVFVCSLLNSQPMGFYPPRILIDDAKRRGVQFLPLSIQASHFDYQLEQNFEQHFDGQEKRDRAWAVRQGFRAVKGLQQTTIDRIVTVREHQGLYKSLTDFIQRTGISQKQCLMLASVHAFAEFGLSAQQVQWQIKAIDFSPQSLFYGQSAISTRPTTKALKANQIECDSSSLKTKAISDHQSAQDFDLLPRINEWQQVQRDYQRQGYSLQKHPVALVRRSWMSQLKALQSDQNQRQLIQNSRLIFTTSDQLLGMSSQKQVSLIGLLAIHQRPPTAKGIVFLTLEDEMGLLNCILKPEIYEKYRLLLRYGSILRIEGELQNREGVANIQVKHCERLI